MIDFMTMMFYYGEIRSPLFTMCQYDAEDSVTLTCGMRKKVKEWLLRQSEGEDQRKLPP